MPLRYNSISIPVNGGTLLLAANAVARPDDGLAMDDVLPSGWTGCPAAAGLLRYDPDAPAAGLCPLSLYELKDYYWEFRPNGRVDARAAGETMAVTSSLANISSKARWNPKFSQGHASGTFCVLSYLGTAWIKAGDDTVRFDVVTAKLNYATEYRWMVEAIAERCQQLLLEWDSPTALPVRAEPAKEGRILLEKFLFLRHVLGPDKLDLYLEILRRRPHSALHWEREWQPAAVARADLYLRDPLRFGRGFTSPGGATMAVPDEVMEERKFDSLDTPPNRFVRFALEMFSEVCDEVLACSTTDYGTAYNEASAMREVLSGFLGGDLFADVGPLKRVPYESQVLQKREGYRQILQAWLMLDAAAQIDWAGREDVYDGQSRDVPTLYEYWLYFTLFDLLKDMPGMQLLHHEGEITEGPREAFGKDADGRLVINLKQGAESYTMFRWTEPDGQSLRLHLFYNREFAQRDDVMAGSYTKTFRPDFSLVIMPGDLCGTWKQCEETAAENGCIAYLHLDAKYRVDKLAEVFGVAASDEDDRADRRVEKATNTFKNADLYKMHTYNEAIRRTVGSYVLYPGAGAGVTEKPLFQRYHEILPGVGAFAVKPGANGQAAGKEALSRFIHDVLVHQVSRFTQHYRINYWTNEVVKDEPLSYGSAQDAPQINEPPEDASTIVGFIRAAAGDVCRDGCLFYFHAVQADGSPQEFDPGVLRAKYFVPFTEQNDERSWLGWFAEVERCELVRLEDLLSWVPASVVESKRPYYYVIHFRPGSIRTFATLPLAAAPVPGAPSAYCWAELWRTGRVGKRP